MNIHECIVSGKPFRNPDMVGAWMLVDNVLVHCDNITTFRDMEWVRNYLVPHVLKYFVSGNDLNHDLYWMKVNCLTRTDWYTIDVASLPPDPYVLNRKRKCIDGSGCQ
jgi:hypothetical protein